MCMTIILIFVGIFIAVLYLFGMLIAIDFLFGILFLVSAANRSKYDKIVPTKLVCKTCGSKNIKIRARPSGANYSGYSAGNTGWYSGTSQVKYERIIECQDCGCVEPFLAWEDIVTAKKTADSRKHLWGALFIISMGITVILFVPK